MSPFTPLTRGDGPDVERTSAPGNDPAVTEWRAALGQSTSAQLRETQTAFEDTADDLKRTMAALAASQQDLTAMQAERDALAVLNAELKAEATEMRSQAEHWLTKLRETAHDLAKANHRNRILTAENEAALRALNEKERHD